MGCLRFGFSLLDITPSCRALGWKQWTWTLCKAWNGTPLHTGRSKAGVWKYGIPFQLLSSAPCPSMATEHLATEAVSVVITLLCLLLPLPARGLRAHTDSKTPLMMLKRIYAVAAAGKPVRSSCALPAPAFLLVSGCWQ